MTAPDARHSDGVSTTKKSLSSSKDADAGYRHAELIYESSADGPLSFHDALSVAADSGGRAYVGDFNGVQVFDPNGRYLNFIKVNGAACGLAFNDRNELFIVSRTQVYKFSIDN
jgi:hypothetical protein